MRLAAQMRGGFYPAHAEAIAHAATFLRSPPGQSFTILDPCAGQGDAILQLSQLLGCPQERVFAIELDESRATVLHANLPEARVLAPASFFGCRASACSFSFIWLNPPFDTGYSTNRVEGDFLMRATDWLVPGGVLAFVCPEQVLAEYSDTRRQIATYYENCSIVPFPEAHRPFHEVILFAHKRIRAHADQERSSRRSWESATAPPGFVYRIPPATAPRYFQKIQPTEAELARLLARSSLRSHLTIAAEVPLPSPPLALGIGHLALLLASGQLDGVVQPENKPAHVVRGTARKKEFVSSVTTTDNPDGSISTKTTISERIDLVVRTVDATGKIQTYRDPDAPEA